MSVVPSLSSDLLYPGCQMTAAEYFTLGQTDARFELVDGALTVSPSLMPLHQRILHQLQFQLELAVQAGCPIVVFPDTDVQFDRRTVYRPDISVYLSARLPEMPDRLTLAPDLIIEVLSASSKGLDLIKKREDYDRAGVREYVAIDPALRRAYSWRRSQAGGTEEMPTRVPMLEHLVAEPLRSSVDERLVLRLAPIWALGTMGGGSNPV